MSSKSSKTEIRLSLRRISAVNRDAGRHARPRSQLGFIGATQPPSRLLLDTTVYIDELQGKLPVDVEPVLRAASLWHSTVTECELAALAGLLDPEHPHTAYAVKQVWASIEQRPEHRILNPDRGVWREAGILAALLAKRRQYGRLQQRKALNDTLIFLSAAKAGLTVLTRNIGDFDLLMQLAPSGSAVFYEIEP